MGYPHGSGEQLRGTSQQYGGSAGGTNHALKLRYTCMIQAESDIYQNEHCRFGVVSRAFPVRMYSPHDEPRYVEP